MKGRWLGSFRQPESWRVQRPQEGAGAGARLAGGCGWNVADKVARERLVWLKTKPPLLWLVHPSLNFDSTCNVRREWLVTLRRCNKRDGVLRVRALHSSGAFDLSLARNLRVVYLTLLQSLHICVFYSQQYMTTDSHMCRLHAATHRSTARPDSHGALSVKKGVI